MEDVLTIVPEPCAIICRATARATTKTPLTLVSMIACQSSSVMLTTGFRTLVPALLKRMSIRPKASTAARTAASTSLALRMSATATRALRPSASTACAVSSSCARVRLTSTRCAPARARASAPARPRPRPAPVTKAILPSRLNSGRLMAPTLLDSRFRSRLKLKKRIVRRSASRVKGIGAAVSDALSPGDMARGI